MPPEDLRTPPYRADHIGSLIRPALVVQARKRAFEDRTIEPEELAEIEDEAVRGIVRMQENAGLLAATDGEIRRSRRSFDFMTAIAGFELEDRIVATTKVGVERARFPAIKERLEFPDDLPSIEHFGHLAKVSRVMPKVSIPGPGHWFLRVDKADIHPREYRDIEFLFADVARVYAKAITAFHDAGCRYLQFDDIVFADLCDPEVRTQKKIEGVDPDWLLCAYARMLNDAIEHRPADMVIALHMEQGDFKIAQARDLAMDAIFNQTSVDVYFLAYQARVAGGLDTLRLLPKGNKRVMAGLIASGVREREKIEDMKRAFDTASKLTDIAQLGIAPDHGFAGDLYGDNPAFGEDDQRRKLDLVVQTAETIWGGVEK